MGLCCGRRAGVVAAPSAEPSRRAIGRSLIFHAVGAFEQVCACAPGALLSEGARWADGSTIPDHAS